jgi:GNAT superfamily N-acetyltransferase
VIEVRPIRTSRERRAFLTFPWSIYRDDPLWVPPILSQRAEAIDPERGPFFKRGIVDFFVAWRDGRPVGTICAGEDRFANQNRQKNECVFGFFDYYEDYEVFESLLRVATDWAVQHNLDTLRGPFNLDYEDSYGVLIEGRDRPPALMCGHTPVYYQGFMERYGFLPARADNLAFAIDLDDTTPQAQRLLRLADKASRREGITIRGANLDDWDGEIDRIHRLMNIALAHLPDHTGWSRDALAALVAPFRTLADPELILFAEVDGEAVGWLPGIPNLNEALIHANGLRYPWDYVKLWYHMRRQPRSLAVKSVLLLPEYWGTPVGVLMFAELGKRAVARGYSWADLSITSADNPTTPMLAERLGAKIYKRYRVYKLPVS